MSITQIPLLKFDISSSKYRYIIKSVFNELFCKLFDCKMFIFSSHIFSMFVGIKYECVEFNILLNEYVISEKVCFIIF